MYGNHSGEFVFAPNNQNWIIFKFYCGNIIFEGHDFSLTLEVF